MCGIVGIIGREPVAGHLVEALKRLEYRGYDSAGVAKHRTDIGKGAFIGSNSALVAPVKIGDRAYVGSGSVVTKNVPADALAVARGEKTNKVGWAKRLQRRKGLGMKKPKTPTT